MATTTPTQSDIRRVVFASVIGATIEWYDFFLYGVVAGIVFNKLFFPTGDAFVSSRHRAFADLPPGAVVATSSLRRKAQLLHRRPDLKLIDIRGNVETRLKTLGYSAFSLNDALQGAKRAFLILDIVLSVIGSIALAVSSLGIVNTMVMSILERTREIGIMKAIGGSNGDIRRIFLIEASAIGLLGGVSGIVLGWAVGRVINFGANIYIQNQGGTPGNLFSLPWWLIGGSIGFAVMVSLIAGSFPAARAARLDPIQALRHD